MKIIIPLIKQHDASDGIAQSFMDATYVCIFDEETSTHEWFLIEDFIKNPGIITIELKLKGIFAVICQNMPYLSVKFFNESNIKVYQAKSENVEENINLFTNNQLALHGQLIMSGCASACSSCSDTDCG